MFRYALAFALAFGMLSGCKRTPGLDQRVRDRIQTELPAANVVIQDPATLEVKVGGQTVTVSLDNVSVICRDKPTLCDEAIERLVQNLAALDQMDRPAVADELRVVLQSEQTVENYRKALDAKSAPERRDDNAFVTFPFQGDLVAVMVRDLPDGIALVNRRELANMQLDAERARTVGVANLEKSLGAISTEMAAPDVFRVHAGDSYEAARLLVPKVWDGLAKQVPGDLLVVAPTREIVLATGSGNPTAVAAMRALAKTMFDAGPYALSTMVLRRTDAGFVVASTATP